MAATMKQVLDVARSQLGYTESPPDSNMTKYGAWFGGNGVAWCAIFVSWCFGQVNALDILHGKDDYTVTMAQRFYNASEWGTAPKPGAIVFFNFGDPTYGGRWKGIHHVGIVEAVLADGRIITLEGNTAPGTEGSQYNGGCVARKVRSTSLVAGYGYPAYTVEKRTYKVMAASTANSAKNSNDLAFEAALIALCKQYGKALYECGETKELPPWTSGWYPKYRP